MLQTASENRLQFVHTDEVFATREDAKLYVLGDNDFHLGTSFDRPALYGEPMVLRYGDEKNPNILLVIGSVGDGVTKTYSNRVFFIDFAELSESIKALTEEVHADEEQINAIAQLLDEVIVSCGLTPDGKYDSYSNKIIENAKSISESVNAIADYVIALEKAHTLEVVDSNTVDLTLVKSPNGMVLSGDVKLCDDVHFKGFHDPMPNAIIKKEDGLYTNVFVGYSGDTISLYINGEKIHSFDIPTEEHVVEGKYNVTDESIHIITNLGNDIVIPMSELIEEWTVLEPEETKTPVVLSKERKGADAKSLLKADVRLFDDETINNILKKTDNGKYLYVDGASHNINFVDTFGKYNDEGTKGKLMNVQEALDASIARISDLPNNIISEKFDGIFADVNVTYDKGHNTLYFTKTNSNGETLESKFELVNIDISIGDEIVYDSTKNELYLHYTSGSNEVKTVTIPMTEVFKDFAVNNAGKTVTLNYSYSNVQGTNTLEANVNISQASDNILVVQNDNLYVKGTADNIAYGDSNVKEKLDILLGGVDSENSLKNLVNNEKITRETSDKILDSKIDAEIVARENAINAEATIRSQAVKEEASLRATSIELEKSAREASDSDLLTKINGEKETARKAEEKLTADLANEVEARVNGDNTLQNGLNSLNDKVDALAITVTANKTNSEAVHAKAFANIGLSSDGVYTPTTTSKYVSSVKSIADAITVLDKKLDEETVSLTNANSSLSNTVANLAEKVAVVETERKSVTDDLTIAIAAEVDARKMAITAEETARKASDATLSSSISEEVEARKNAIISESDARKASDATLSSSISDETIARKEADVNLNIAITAEATARKEAVSNESIARTEADTALSTSISNEATARETAIEKVKTTLATTAENLTKDIEKVSENVSDVNSNLLAEIADRAEGDSQLEGKINAIKASLESLDTQTIKKVEIVKNNDLQYFLNINDVKVSEINIPKDQFLKDASYDEDAKKLSFTFVTSTGETTTKISIKDLVDTYTAADGLSLINKTFSIKVNPASQKFIQVDANGIAIIGVTEALALKADKTTLASLDEKVIGIKGEVDVINGNDAVAGSITNSLKQAKTYTDGKFATLSETVVSNFNELDGKVANATNIINGNTSSITALKTASETHSIDITALETRATSIENSVINNTNAISKIDTKVSNLDEAVKEFLVIDGKLEKITSDIADNDVKITNNVAKTQVNTETISAVTKSLEVLTHRVDDNDVKITNNVATIASHTSSIRDIELDVNTIKTSLGVVDTVSSKVTEIGNSMITDVKIEQNAKNGLQYYLVVNGKTVSEINIPKDQFLKDVKYVPVTKELEFTFETSSGIQTTKVGIGDLVKTYTAGDGIKLTDNKFEVEVDRATESYLTISQYGIKVNGIDAIANTANANKTDVATLKSEVNDLKTLLATVQNSLSTMSGTIDGLKQQISALSSNVESMGGRISTVEGTITAVNTSLGTVTSTVNTLSANVNSISSKVDNIEENGVGISESIDCGDY